MTGTNDSWRPSRAVQLTGSLLVAVVIVVAAIWLTVARLGTDPELTEERQEERLDLQEERREAEDDAHGP